MLKSATCMFDRLFKRDRQIAEQAKTVVRQQDEQHQESKLNVEEVKQILNKEKSKQSVRHTINTSRPNNLNVTGKQPTTFWRARDHFSNQLKEIMGFGTTMRSLKQCLDKQTKEAQPLFDMPSISDVKLRDSQAA